MEATKVSRVACRAALAVVLFVLSSPMVTADDWDDDDEGAREGQEQLDRGYQVVKGVKPSGEVGTARFCPSTRSVTWRR
ncbi:hypothetical protein GUJ93_ZPchr0005g16268 [Zizania palustris]|uniref:Uncharacterized protein n=1 Tax=Zizania palustris TaxID=103762 RepID=A0A8J5SYC1_ZIZPA|nr:hypothetical protein GUJ93_ZPchr0005g16268 [Zizania palustris]